MAAIQRFMFRFRMWRAHTSPAFIASAYGFLVDLDRDEPLELPNGLVIEAFGNYVCISNSRGTWTIQDNKAGEIFVSKKVETPQMVTIAGVRYKTQWKEIYRTGKLARDLSFMPVLTLTLLMVGTLRTKIAGRIAGRTVMVPDPKRWNGGGTDAKDIPFRIDKVSLAFKHPGFIFRDAKGDVIDSTFREALELSESRVA